MDLYKNFTFGGLFQAGKRMAPPWGAFRRFTNTYKDPTGTLKPYGRGPSASNDPTPQSGNGVSGYNFRGPISTQTFRKGILQLHVATNGSTKRGTFSYIGPDGSNLPVMQPFSVSQGKNFVDIRKHMTYMPSGNLSSCTVARKGFLVSSVNTADFDTTATLGGSSPKENYLLSFDGVRVRGAGLPLPWNFADTAGVAASFYVRGIYMTIGLDGEPIFSQYLQHRLASATQNLYLSGYSTYPTVKRSGVLATDTLPTYRAPDDHLFEELTSDGTFFDAAGSNTRYFDKRFIRPAGFVSVVAGELTIIKGAISSAVEIGDWVMIDLGRIGPTPADLYMFKVKTIGTNVTFENGIRYLDQNSVTWIDAKLSELYTQWNTIDVDIAIQFEGLVAGTTFSNLFLIVAYSTTANSGFAVHNIYPMEWDQVKTVAANFASIRTFKRPWAGVVSSLLSDWYDTSVVRTTFPPLKGITNYKELLVGFDSNALYFTDVTLGGSTEMVSGISNLVPFGSEYGDIVAICGSEDFLLVSRERKNYVITGDIAGPSFNITECDSPVPGAYNVRTATNAWAGQILFANKSGIFAISSSGAIKDISEEIKGLFFHTNVDGNLFDKAVFKTLTSTRSTGFDGGIFKFLLEDSRGFVVFLTAQANLVSDFTSTYANMLVLNTKDGKWYEFEGGDCSSIEAAYGKIIALGVNRAIEDGVMRISEKQLLVTQRMTIDAPSVKKQVCQVKMFAEITPTTSGTVRGLTIGQINDWKDFNGGDRSNWNTNEIYTPKIHEIYDHKKRLDSSKPVATSVIIESLATGSFSLEGLEIEGVVVQTGMKT